MKQGILVLLTLVMAAMLISGCLGKQTKPAPKAEPLKACTSYDTSYKASALAVPVVAKKKLNQCAVITDLVYISLNTGYQSIFQDTLDEEGMGDWTIASFIPEGQSNYLSGLVPPKLAEQLASLSTNQKINVKGMYVGNRIGRQTVSLGSRFSDTTVSNLPFIVIDEIVVK